jgi:hypothetical protein
MIRFEGNTIVNRRGILPRYGTAVFRRFVFVFAWAVGFTCARAAFEELAPDARTAAMGAAFIASLGPESVLSNPAGIGGGDPGSACFSSAVPYGLKELSVHSLCAAFSSRLGGIGLAVSTSGRTVYRETTVAAGWSMRFDGRVAAGIALRILNLRIDRYGSWTGCAIDAAVRIPLNERWTVGFSGTNINQARVEKQSPVPQTTRIGLLHAPAGNLILAAEIEKDARYPAGFHGGIEWKPLPGLALRWGFGRGPAQAAFGFGLTRRRLGLDYACSVHPVLGATHQASIRFHFRAGK